MGTITKELLIVGKKALNIGLSSHAQCEFRDTEEVRTKVVTRFAHIFKFLIPWWGLQLVKELLGIAHRHKQIINIYEHSRAFVSGQMACASTHHGQRNSCALLVYKRPHTSNEALPARVIGLPRTAVIGKNILLYVSILCIMWLMPLGSLSNCDYEL